MKINNQITSNLIQPKDSSKASINGFEEWLNSLQKQKTGDEYYWYHQQQLELSDLHFNSLSKQTEVEPIELNSDATKTHHYGIEENKLEKYEANLTVETEVAKQIPSASRVEYILEHNQSPLNQEFGIIANQNSVNSQLKPKCFPRISCSENKAVNRNLVFKEHQLFIQGEEAEFSLNSVNLTQQQSEELSQLVKEWLRSKGIRLQQLIINGVKQ